MLLQPGPVGELDYVWVDRDAIAWDAARAVIASEDQRFVEHHGIDFVSLDRALADYRGGDGLRGASTITQQVAKNLFLWQGRSFVRKALEAYFAVLIEIVLDEGADPRGLPEHRRVRPRRVRRRGGCARIFRLARRAR